MCLGHGHSLKKIVLDNNINYFIMKYHIMLGQFMETDTNYEYANLNCGRTLAQNFSQIIFLAYFFLLFKAKLFKQGVIDFLFELFRAKVDLVKFIDFIGHYFF